MDSNDTINENQSLFVETLKGLVFSAITFATIAGNSLSLLALIMTGKWHTRYLIVSLAVTDLLLGALVMPFATISSIKLRWLFGSMWCQTQGSLGFLFCQVSVITITLVSVERHILFTYPNLHFKWFSQSNCQPMKYIMVTTWVYSGLWTFLAWQISQFSYTRELLNCVVDWRYNYTFTLICGIITSCVPICVILFCNFKVLQIIKSWNFTKVGSSNETLKKKIADVKISRMLLIVVVAFLVCWTPYSVGGICYLLPNCIWPEEYFIVSVFLCLLNSCINPIIYGTFDRRFRKAVRFIVWRVLYFKSKTRARPKHPKNDQHI